MEVWKDIAGYEGLYQVSNLGRVKSLDRFARVKGNGMQLKKGRIMAQKIRSKSYPYLCVTLSRNNKTVVRPVHRLVAESFIPNLENKPQVNHIDENKTNNRADNLEWATPHENMHHNNLVGRINRTAEKPVNAYDKQGNLVFSFSSITEAEKKGFSRSAISQNINGRSKTSGGYVWKLAE